MKKLLSFILIFALFVSGMSSASALTVAGEAVNNYSFEQQMKYLEELKEERGTTYSSKELREISNHIGYYMGKSEAIDFGNRDVAYMISCIVWVSLDDDDEHNCVEVGIYKLDDKKAELFKKYISDSDAVILYNSGKIALDTGSIPHKSKVDASGIKRIKIAPGKTKTIPIINRYKIQRWTSSDSSVISVKNGKITARKKGKATITAVYGSALKVKFKYKVKDDPKLTAKGKKVTYINIKKGKTKTLKLEGKASAYKNKYTNTKYAKILSKKNSKSIKIKGLKKGKTTLKIRVNKAKTLNLKVNVI